MGNATRSKKRWDHFWKERRSGSTISDIAKKNEISVQAVYKALSSKNSKIESLLLAAAKTNRISVYRYSEMEGFLWGYSPAFKSEVYITHSPKTGTQVWHEHEGDCIHCDAFAECLWILKTEAEERKIPLPKTSETPTQVALFLFETIKQKLLWDERVIQNAKKDQ
ncbi:MAG: hypothetical protein ACW97Z_15575 [Candidatus Hodarchaeales archaeon]|jgi:hypothetical protein